MSNELTKAFKKVQSQIPHLSTHSVAFVVEYKKHAYTLFEERTLPKFTTINSCFLSLSKRHQSVVLLSWNKLLQMLWKKEDNVQTYILKIFINQFLKLNKI